MEMARRLCVSQGTYSLWENDKVKIDNESLQNLADFFGVSVDYILGREESNRPPKSRRGKWIPVYGEIAAGIPIEAIEDIIDYEEIPDEMAATGDYIALRIKGDSMEPRIKEGDVVIIRRQENVENGEIAAVMVNGDNATLKQIKREDNQPGISPRILHTQRVREPPYADIGAARRTARKILKGRCNFEC